MSNGTSELSWLDGVAALNATLEGNATYDGEPFPVSTTRAPGDSSPYPSGYSKLSFVATAFVVTCIMVLIVVGNMLVCIAIATEKTLKTIQNWFIASLAVSDFLIGLIIMPFSLAKELMGYWIFGTLWCDVHAALDVLICTASINNLCLISLDRYWSVTHAVEYLKKRTASRAMAMICFVWLLSALISLPPLVGWKKSQQSSSDYPQCSVSEDVGYVLYSALGSFYVPAVVMVFVYIRIFLAARSRARRHVKKQARHVPELTNDPVRDKSTTTTTTTCTSFSNPSPPDSSAAHKMNGGGGGATTQRRGLLPSSAPQIIIETPEEPSSAPPSPLLPRHQEGLGLRAPDLGPSGHEESEAAPLQGSHDAPGLLSAPHSRVARSPYGSTLSLNERDEDSELCESSNAAGGESSGGSGGGTTNKRGGSRPSSSRNRPAPPQGLTYAVARHSPSDAERHKRKLAKARERRATMILGLIMAAFILAWLPFFVIYVLGALCKPCSVGETVFAVAFWLGYCNSAVNPIIYTIFNRDFRKAFRKILFR